MVETAIYLMISYITYMKINHINVFFSTVLKLAKAKEIDMGGFY